jgi:hypothetical protein
MTAPNIPKQFPFPSAGEQPITYPELLEKLRCTCPAGAQIKSSQGPASVANIGDVIAPVAQYLSTFTSAYSMITVILRMIACIMDVLCALTNPFAVLAAVIKLFGICLPDFILIFPQLAIPSIIICVIKIVLAIVQYILTVIIPIIMDIIQNVEMLINAFKSYNQDAIAAVAFKVTALIKELYNVVGILSVLSSLFIMIQALLSMGIAIPCGGAGGSCDTCATDQCPAFIKDNTIVSGSDGQFSADMYLTATPPSYLLHFDSPSNRMNFLGIQGFFPRGLDYSKFSKIAELPYYVEVANSTYAATSVNDNGSVNLLRVPQTMNSDGYLSNLTGSPLAPVAEAPNGYGWENFIRFGTKTSTFNPTYVGAYMQLEDTVTPANSGMWKINKVYDAHNVELDRGGEGQKWTISNSRYAELNPSPPFVNWYVVPFGGPREFTFNINHTELMRYGLIGVGCHPAVQATMVGLKNRFPDASDIVLPDLPDFDKLMADSNACIAKVGPIDVDSQYVLDNYNMIAENAPGVAICLANTLGQFQSDMTDYVKEIYPRIFSPEKSQLSANPLVEIVGNKITATVIPYDIYGAKLASTLPPGIIEVHILTDAGELGPTSEILDAYGNSTGAFEAQITSPIALSAHLTAQIADKLVSYFDGYNLVPKVVEVRFVEPQVVGKRDEASPEPLGRSTGR